MWRLFCGKHNRTPILKKLFSETWNVQKCWSWNMYECKNLQHYPPCVTVSVDVALWFQPTSLYRNFLCNLEEIVASKYKQNQTPWSLNIADYSYTSALLQTSSFSASSFLLSFLSTLILLWGIWYVSLDQTCFTYSFMEIFCWAPFLEWCLYRNMSLYWKGRCRLVRHLIHLTHQNLQLHGAVSINR